MSAANFESEEEEEEESFFSISKTLLTKMEGAFMLCEEEDGRGCLTVSDVLRCLRQTAVAV